MSVVMLFLFRWKKTTAMDNHVLYPTGGDWKHCKGVMKYDFQLLVVSLSEGQQWVSLRVSCLCPCWRSFISPLINMWTWNLTCSASLSLSVCIDTGNGSVMEAAQCGRAAAGRLKLQVERVRRRSCSMFPHCSKKRCVLRWHEAKKRPKLQCKHFDSYLSGHCPSVSSHWTIHNTSTWKLFSDSLL